MENRVRHLCRFTVLCCLIVGSITVVDYILKYRYARNKLAPNLKLDEYRLVLWKPFIVELHIGDPDHYNCTYTYFEVLGSYRLIEKVSEHSEPNR
jgi:hypothetical protein